MRSLRVERRYPFVLAALALGLAAWLPGGLERPLPALLFASTVTLGAIVAGFVGTCLSVLIVLKTPLMENIRETEYLDTLANYIGWTLFSGLLLAFVGLAGLLLEDCNRSLPPPVWCASVVFCTGCLWRISGLALKIFRGTRK
ncbi:MAG: hypothetical protein OXC19_08820 [Bryobacterales bacterium]|nr:hypothetical protein [Bryobacterales bacterium]